MKSFLVIAVVALVGYPALINSAKPCKPRTFNHESNVCVCDENYCDTFDKIVRMEKGILTVYESDRAGKRMEARNVSFGNDLPGPVSRTVSINRKETFQEIMGFGASWSDAVAIGLGRLSPALRTAALRAYYSDDGIEYSTARVVISGCDFSTRMYSYDDTVDDWELNSWGLASEDVDLKIPQMQEIQEHSSHPIKFIGSSWSPPGWMKTNGEINHGGSLIGDAGSDEWKSYARYLLKFFSTYKDNGIDFWGMTVQNEPPAGGDPTFPWNVCYFNATMERDFAKMDLGPIMEEAGFGPDTFKIMVLDYNRPLAEEWANIVFSDEEASRYVAGLSVHWYYYGTVEAGPYQVYDNIHNQFPDKFILATEACNRNEEDENDRIALGKWSLAEDYAHDILLDLLHWVTGWGDWNLVLDMQGGPNYVGNYHSAPIIVNPDAGEFYKNVQYYAMAHFSKFLPPGTKRIAATPQVEVEGELELGAFLRPDGGVAITVINTQDQEHIFVVQDPDVGNVTIAVGPHSFNSWVYYI